MSQSPILKILFLIDVYILISHKVEIYCYQAERTSIVDIKSITTEKEETNFISYHPYVLRFSDRIDGMKNPYGNFFIQSRTRNDFLTRFIQSEITCQNESVISQRVHAVVTPLQSSFTEVCRRFPQVYTCTLLNKNLTSLMFF